VFNVERTGGPKTNSPNPRIRTHASHSFGIDPKRVPYIGEAERMIHSSSQRKGKIDPSLVKMLSENQDEQVDVYSQRNKSNKSKDPDYDPNEESKLSYQEGFGAMSAAKQREMLSKMDNNSKPPFRIFRPIKRDTELNKNSIYYDCSENIDFVNNAEGKVLEMNMKDETIESIPTNKKEKIASVSFQLIR
jgi:hypothetical protein